MPEDLTKSPWYAFGLAVRRAARTLDEIEARRKRDGEGGQQNRTPGGSGRA